MAARETSRGSVRDVEHRRRVVTRTVAATVAVAVVATVLALAYVPRTILAGGVILADDGEVLDPGWEVRAAPGLLRPRIEVRTSADAASLRFDGLPPASIDDTAVTHVDGLVQPYTVVAGPTPWRTASVRHTSVERGAGEAAVRRLAWRRVHVAVVAGRIDVTEVVAIDRGGGIRATARPDEVQSSP